MKTLFQVAIYVLSIILISNTNLIACGACSATMNSYNSSFDIYKKNHSISFSSNVKTYGVYIPGGYEYFLGYHSTNLNGHQHGTVNPSAYYKQVHITHELRGNYQPVERVGISLILPLVQKRLFSNNALIEDVIGVGDAMLQAQYYVLNKMTKDSTRFKQRLSVGGGLKFPTGKFRQAGYDGLAEPSRQPGTGSFDFVIGVEHLVMYRQFGMNTIISYKANTKNKNGFRFANTFGLEYRMFYSQAIKKLNVVPNIGFNYEQSGRDQLNGEAYLLNSKGKMLSGSVGLDVYYMGIGVSFTYYRPLKQSLEGVQFENKQRFSAGLRYVFPDKIISNRKFKNKFKS